LVPASVATASVAAGITAVSSAGAGGVGRVPLTVEPPRTLAALAFRAAAAVRASATTRSCSLGSGRGAAGAVRGRVYEGGVAPPRPFGVDVFVPFGLA